MGFSLIYVCVYYPRDAISGAIIEIISALTILKYQEKILNNKIAPLIGVKKRLDLIID